jgi:hypothetical protein
MDIEHKQNIRNFMRNLLEQIDNNTLSDESYEKVKDFYIDYGLKKVDNDFSEYEMMKFFTLGWYIYNNIIKTKD